MVHFNYLIGQVFLKDLESNRYSGNENIEEICATLTNLINWETPDKTVTVQDVEDTIGKFNDKYGFDLNIDDFGVIRNTNEVYETDETTD